jgi:hypothetical protein
VVSHFQIVTCQSVADPAALDGTLQATLEGWTISATVGLGLEARERK